MGSITGNNVDLARVELLLGIDPLLWWVLAVDIDFTDFGKQAVTALAVPARTTRSQLMDFYSQGLSVPVTAFEAVMYEAAPLGVPDATMPNQLPVSSAAEFLMYGFKHLEMRLHVGWADLPEDLLLETADTIRVEAS
ncbi:MAG: hypothetical protein Q7L55_00805 [Actinomycetota bacterium]|nr:hypothetical protein [Actinomycetota bacterium]